MKGIYVNRKVLHKNNRICFFASYEEPEVHRHFAKHIIMGREPFLCTVSGVEISSRGVFIKSLEPHFIQYNGNSEVFVMLIDETSDISKIIDDVYLNGKVVAEIPSDIYDIAIQFFLDKDLLNLDKTLNETLFSPYISNKEMDDRINNVIYYIENLETIESQLYKQMADMVCLSESRFSHLFKSEIGIDFKNYLLMKKFEKAYASIVNDNLTITEASIKAGFSSSSHFATVCKKYFGISLSRFMKSLK